MPIVVTYNQTAFGEYVEDDAAVTLRNSGGDCGGGSEVLIVLKDDATPKIGGDICYSLTREGHTPVIMSYQNVTGTVNAGAHPGSYNGQDAYNDMLVVDENNYDKSQLYAHGRDNGRDGIEPVRDGLQRPTDRDRHRGGDDMNEPAMMGDRKGHNGVTTDGTATTLTAQEKERPVAGTSIVRRLTEKECERIQGFPDDWSKYGLFNGKVKELSSSARYRLQGNSIARPFWKWLTKRISAQYERTPTLGSLFDGQGGFPLCWEEVNGKGSAVWASEIEPNAVAVTKLHFPEE